jgi:hypothetical protein
MGTSASTALANLTFIPARHTAKKYPTFWPRRSVEKFGLDRFERPLQALVDGQELESLNLFSGQ